MTTSSKQSGKECGCSCHSIKLGWCNTCCWNHINKMKTQKDKPQEKLEEYVDRMVKEKHKTCLTDQFDNGMFWAYKDIQKRLLEQRKRLEEL